MRSDTTIDAGRMSGVASRSGERLDYAAIQHDRSILEHELLSNGVVVKNSKAIRCPFHGGTSGDKRPSAEIRQQGGGVWRFKCYACDKCEDVFGVRALLQSTTREDALRNWGNQSTQFPKHIKHSGNDVTAGSVVEEPKMTTEEAEAIHAKCCANIKPELIESLSRQRGISARTLQYFGLGWTGRLLDDIDDDRRRYRGCFSFPIRRPGGSMCGIRLMRPGGNWFKFTVLTSAPFLFVPDHCAHDEAIDQEWLLVTEGEGDAMAATDLGFRAIGTCGISERRIELVVAYIMATRPQKIGVIADCDEQKHDGRFPGQDAALALARRIAQAGFPVRVRTMPDAKDLREWKVRTDASHDDLLGLLESPAVRQTVIGGVA